MELEIGKYYTFDKDRRSNMTFYIYQLKPKTQALVVYYYKSPGSNFFDKNDVVLSRKDLLYEITNPKDIKKLNRNRLIMQLTDHSSSKSFI